MKILHILAYEKFLPHIIETSEAINPGQNRYISCSAKGKTGYLPPPDISCRLQSGAFNLDMESRWDIEWCDALFLHPLSRSTSASVSAMTPGTVAVWCAMGGEYYKYSRQYQNSLYLPKTEKVMRELTSNRSVSKKIGDWFSKNIKSPLRSGQDPVSKVAGKIDFICALENDPKPDFLKDFSAENIGEFPYYTFESALSSGAEPVDGEDILIGNSAHRTNNHFDIIEQLRNVDLGGGRIVLPLSYGPADYAIEVDRFAKSTFGEEKIVTLDKWLPISEYNRILTRCGTVFMNHNRGQAMGNICSMVMRGARVYLRTENPYAEFLAKLGVTFEYISDNDFDGSILDPLPAAEKSSNRQIIIDYWSRAAVEKRTAALFEKVGNNINKSQ